MFAVSGGSIVRMRVSPYGYGRVLYQLLDDGNIVVYAHLSRFSGLLERRIKAEQKKTGRFTVDWSGASGEIRVRKGEIIGYTGRSGTVHPHLHFEMRDSENRPFNPVLAGFSLSDSIPPTPQAVAASPLDFGSHVEGEFFPALYRLRRIGTDRYQLLEPIRMWGTIGLSVSVFDLANDADNAVAVYRLRLVVDNREVLEIRYDGFSYENTRQIDLDRNYPLNRRGFGLFQNLYVDRGNTLPFYRPALPGTGTLQGTDFPPPYFSPDGRSPGLNEQNPWDGALALEGGDHPFRIETSDIEGNTAVIEGWIKVLPAPLVWTESPWAAAGGLQDPPGKGGSPRLFLDTDLYGESVRFSVRAEGPYEWMPSLSIRGDRPRWTVLTLIPRRPNEWIASLFPDPGKGNSLFVEARLFGGTGFDRTVADTLRLFRVSPDETIEVVSSDGQCRLLVPQGSVYKPALLGIRRIAWPNPDAVLGVRYDVFPKDVLLREPVKIAMDLSTDADPDANTDAESLSKIGVYKIGPDDHATNFLGAAAEGGRMEAWTSSLDGFAVMRDTTAPRILFVQPRQETHTRKRTPDVTFGFLDRLSGIGGEDDYVVILDGVRRLVEYDPVENHGHVLLDGPLALGGHALDIRIRDRAGNEARWKGRFFVDP